MKKRMEWLDIAKGIAILLVIIGHVGVIPWEPWRKIIFSVHMPLFFIAAGITTKGVAISTEYCKRLFKRLMIPYVITAILGMVILAVKTKGGISILTEIERMFWASGVPADYGPGIPVTGESNIPVIGAIWFLPCIFIGKLLFDSTLKRTEKSKEWLRCSVVLVFTILGYIVGQKIKIPMGIDISMFVMIFMYSGYLMKKYDILNKKYQTIAIGAMVLWIFALKVNAIELSARFYRPFPDCIFSVLGAIGGSYLVFVVSYEVIEKVRLCKGVLIFCGQHSLLMLCVHHLEGSVIDWGKIATSILSGLNPFYQGIGIAILRILVVFMVSFTIVMIKQRGNIINDKTETN